MGAGIPQNWAAHMIGMELTALFGVDHGQTLAILYPATLEIRKEKKSQIITIRRMGLAH
jgi:NADP-dependent alcohol dehydrogenase